MIATKITLRAPWMVADDRLVENEYFGRIAGDFYPHANWIAEGERRLQGIDGQNNSSSAHPSAWWLNVPARAGKGSGGFVSQHELGRWRKRMRAILALWMPLQESGENHVANSRVLRQILESLLESHFGGDGYGAQRTGRALIEEMKADDAVDRLGEVAAETLQLTFNRFLERHPDLVEANIHVQFKGPYT